MSTRPFHPDEAEEELVCAHGLPASLKKALDQHLPPGFRNMRSQRYRGEDFDIALASLSDVDQAHVRVVYELAKTLHNRWVAMRDAPDWDALRQLVATVLRAPFVDAAKAMGHDTMATCHDEATRQALGKVLHDLRGGALTPLQLYARMAEWDTDPLHLRSAAFLARDQAKIMRNILPDLDPAVRRADEAEKPHFMHTVVETWDGFQFERGDQTPGHVRVACGYQGLLASCCLEASAVDRIVYNYVNNAMRFTTGDTIHLDIAPVGEHAVRWVVANPIAPDQGAWLRQNTKGDLGNLFRGGLTRGGTGVGLSNCADFVAAAFGLPDIDIALDGKYLGAAVEGDWYLAWAHWPSLYAA
jgi:K+-sensing histidine kinase KdpD